MRWLTVVALVTCPLVVGPGPVALGQTSSPSPAASAGVTDVPGRFVLSEGGYAVTFPEGWEVQVHPVDWSPVPVVRAEEPREDDGSGGIAFCEVKVAGPCGDSCSTLVDGWAASEVDWWEGGTEVPVPSIIASEALSLPAVHAVRVDVRYDDDWGRSIYMLTDGQVAATLLCIAPAPPDDGWLSVAETFEFLPAEP